MPGSGLGLAIVRQVVDRHGGRIEVSEAPGRRGPVRAVAAGRARCNARLVQLPTPLHQGGYKL